MWCSSFLFFLSLISQSKNIMKVVLMKFWTEGIFLFLLLRRAENLPDLREEVGAWCAVRLFSAGTARWRFCWDQPGLLSSAPHTRPHPWGSAGCWALAAAPTTRQEWGKLPEKQNRNWFFCYSFCNVMILISNCFCVIFDSSCCPFLSPASLYVS